MCAITAVAIGIMALGTAYSMHAEGQAAKYNAAVDVQNAKLANTQAQNANAMGSYAADQARIRGNLMRGQQIAVMAANNVDVTTGSAADILGDTAMTTAANERQARINAAQRAYGFQVQSLSDQGAAQYAKWQGKTQQTGTLIRGIGSMVSTAAAAMGASGGTGSAGMNSGTVLTGANYSGFGNTSYMNMSWGGGYP